MPRTARTLRIDSVSGDERRLLERVRFGGSVRLVVRDGGRAVARSGQLVDLSESGCQLRVYKPVLRDVEARIEMTDAGIPASVGVVVRWVREDGPAWRIGCEFAGQPAAIRNLVNVRKARWGGSHASTTWTTTQPSDATNTTRGAGGPHNRVPISDPATVVESFGDALETDVRSALALVADARGERALPETARQLSELLRDASDALDSAIGMTVSARI